MGEGLIAAGDVLDGRYEIVRELGAGSMGLVYEAVHRELARGVALKTLRAEIAGDEELLGRFQQEARAASAIGHENIVQIFDAGRTAEGLPYMVMEKLDGESLFDLLRAQPLLEPARAVEIGQQVLCGLGAAHRCGIVHRDLKPENIFLCRAEGEVRVKLLDFGISKVLERAEPWIAGESSAARATRMGAVLGTPLYMAPEQARGLTDVDHRADLWATACVLYEMLCGRTPYQGENYNQILGAILDGQFPRPRELRPSIPAALEKVILRGLSGDREVRWSDAGGMREALLAAVREPASADQGAKGEEALMSALDRLTESSLVGGHAPESEAPAPEAPAPQAPAPPPEPAPPEPGAGETAGDAGPGADAFAPPGGAAEDPLDVDLDAIRQGPAFGRSRAGPSRPAPASASRRAAARPREPRVRLRALLKGVLVLALLVAGAGVGYRYYLLGYWGLEAPADEEIPVRFRLVPEDAEIVANGELLATRPFRAQVGTDYEFLFRAPGRLSVRKTLTAEEDASPVLRARLPLAAPALHPATARRYRASRDRKREEAEPRSFAAIESALGKLALYDTCLGLMAEPLEEGRDAFMKSARGTIRPGNLPVVLSLPSNGLVECRAAIEAAQERSPPLEAIDAAATEYLEALEEVVPKNEDLRRRLDREQLGRVPELTRDVRAGYRRAMKAQEELSAAVLAERTAWQRAELEGIRRTRGETLHWHLRRTALASRARALALAGRASQKERRRRLEVLKENFETARDYADAHPEELEAIEGAAAYLKSLENVLDAEAGEILSWYNRSVEIFNGLVL